MSPHKPPGRCSNQGHPDQEYPMSPDRPFPDDDYHQHFPDAEGDYMVLLMAVAALVPAPPDVADEPVLVRADGDVW